MDTARRECNSCCSILEINKDDLYKSQFHFDLVFNCPVCGIESTVDMQTALKLGAIDIAYENIARRN